MIRAQEATGFPIKDARFSKLKNIPDLLKDDKKSKIQKNIYRLEIFEESGVFCLGNPVSDISGGRMEKGICRWRAARLKREQLDASPLSQYVCMDQCAGFLLMTILSKIHPSIIFDEMHF